MSLEQIQFRAEDAKQLLANPMLKDAFTAVEGYLEAKALTCEPDNKDMAQRVILSKQLLAAIKREITRHIENGQVAEIQIAELERKRFRNPFRR
jgi:hypothetical protein